MTHILFSKRNWGIGIQKRWKQVHPGMFKAKIVTESRFRFQKLCLNRCTCHLWSQPRRRQTRWSWRDRPSSRWSSRWRARRGRPPAASSSSSWSPSSSPWPLPSPSLTAFDQRCLQMISSWQKSTFQNLVKDHRTSLQRHEERSQTSFCKTPVCLPTAGCIFSRIENTLNYEKKLRRRGKSKDRSFSKIWHFRSQIWMQYFTLQCRQGSS